MSNTISHTRITYWKKCCILVFWSIPFALITQAITFTNCAQPNPPGGGPKDTLPPALLATSIPAQAVNVKEKKVIFYFTENVQLKNKLQEIMINPKDLKNRPEVYVSTNRIIIQWKTPLQRNTTYSIDFGNAIYDLNESNAYERRLYFPFSTGKSFDSLVVYGSILDAKTGVPKEGLIATLYGELEDSAVFLKDPDYMTKVDSIGRYVFFNVRPGTYRFYAMKDKSYLGRYLNTNQDFAFLDEELTLSERTTQIPLIYSFLAEKKGKKRQSSKKKKRKDDAEDEETQDSLTYEINLKQLYTKDTLQLTFSKLLTTFDTSKIFVLRDSLPYSGHRWTMRTTQDSSGHILSLIMPLLPEEQHFELILLPDCITDSSKNTLQTADTIRFTSAPEENYGMLRIEHKQKEVSRHYYVAQLLKNNQLFMRIPLDDAVVEISDVPVGTYSVTILDDLNDNGVWDAGSFWEEKRQPEFSIALKEKLTIRSQEESIYKIVLER